MTRNEPGEHSGKLERMAEWLDAKLVRTIGPPPIGPYEGEQNEQRDASDSCPLCDHPMREHRIDRSHPNAVLICPVAPNPEVESYEPLNEVGMPKRPRPGDGDSALL